MKLINIIKKYIYIFFLFQIIANYMTALGARSAFKMFCFKGVFDSWINDAPLKEVVAGRIIPFYKRFFLICFSDIEKSVAFNNPVIKIGNWKYFTLFLIVTQYFFLH